ncbi:aminotransferase class III-fold pyridoxal phosphate-dependent enzyme [bacterium]|nr:aminotransferase class III-fold pyridoxal phosphate-dependent enzyme [bacterium]
MTDPLQRRRRVMGSGMRTSYDLPIHAASASGVWITDANGTDYLDAYNNVPHVGHGRPEVVEAIARQTARLNTNTRYVVDVVVEYAERVTALLPDSLDVILFTTSGSEANDLAWRIARTVTANATAIVTANAYHGATTATIQTSPEERGHKCDLATFPIPAGFQADAFDRIVTSLPEAPAFVAVDTVFSSDGVHVPPPGSLGHIAAIASTAGGLFIADEVQAGFGRIGPAMWGFAAHDVVPDIVTLGKPMGNGYPVAAVVTTTEIAERFWEHEYYFSTFAGNPVAAAAGIAVLDVVEGENLATHAQEIGDTLRSGIRDLNHPVIGDVRGPGLFIGVEIVDDSDRPDPIRAAHIVETMRNHRVLIGRTGPHHNVLKIRPPLVFDHEHSAILLEALESALA